MDNRFIVALLNVKLEVQPTAAQQAWMQDQVSESDFFD
jgi:hypothetical protein